jgi:hypothetical protein
MMNSLAQNHQQLLVHQRVLKLLPVCCGSKYPCVKHYTHWAVDGDTRLCETRQKVKANLVPFSC